MRPLGLWERRPREVGEVPSTGIGTSYAARNSRIVPSGAAKLAVSSTR